MPDKKVLVTVGTTRFDKLIECVSSNEILDILTELGYSCVLFQTGNGYIIDPKKHDRVKLKFCTYIENFDGEIADADLVISHAGAGTCLDVLRKNKPLIVVINEDLMDNHQTELAEQLQSLSYLYYCTCNTLKGVLKNDFSQLKKYPLPENTTFSTYLDECVGFK